MAELRALWMPGRAAGVHLDGAMLPRDWQGRIARRLRRKPFGIADPAGMRAVERDDAAHGFQIGRDLLDQRIEIGADEQQLGAGIVDHIGDFRRRQPEIDRHQHDIGFGGAEPKIEEGRRVFRQIGDARLRTHAFGDQAVGDLIGAAVELAEGGALAFEMDGDAIRTDPGMMARDVADGHDVGKALDVEHGNPPQGAFLLSPRLCASRFAVSFVGSFRVDRKRKNGRVIAVRKTAAAGVSSAALLLVDAGGGELLLGQPVLDDLYARDRVAAA